MSLLKVTPTSTCTNRWVCIRIESLAGVFAAGLAAYLVYGGSVTASDTGFSLTMASTYASDDFGFSAHAVTVGFSGLILWYIRILNEFEVSGA